MYVSNLHQSLVEDWDTTNSGILLNILHRVTFNQVWACVLDLHVSAVHAHFNACESRSNLLMNILKETCV